jgi:hypothetical protein
MFIVIRQQENITSYQKHQIKSGQIEYTADAQSASKYVFEVAQHWADHNNRIHRFADGSERQTIPGIYSVKKYEQ